jgi:ligand-binding sensor domain-containing protein/signal transduction histidine kinase
LRSSSIFRNGSVLTRLAIISLAGNAYALDPGRTVSQYLRDQWTTEKGFPGGPVSALAQTPDGYLWIGAEAGLVRFDGKNFRVTRQPDPTSFPIDHVLGLTTDGQGSLWLRLPAPTLVRYSGGAFTFVTPDSSNFDPFVTAMVRAKRGGLLFSSRRGGLSVFNAPRIESLASVDSLLNSPVTSIAEAGEDDVWLGTLDQGLLRLRGKRILRVTTGATDLKINCLVAGEKGELWAGTDHGILQWNGRDIARPAALAPLAHSQILAMIRDHDSNIWIGTGASGLVRFNASGLSFLDQSNGIFNAAVTAVYEDREGSIWTGGPDGIERLRDRLFASYPTAQGESNGPVYADSRGRVWWAPSGGGLRWLSDGRVRAVDQGGLEKDVVYSITGSGDDLWIGRQRGGLTHLLWRNGSFRSETYSRKDGLADNTVFSVSESRDGAIWAGTLNAGASRLRDGHFTTYTNVQGLAADTVNAIVEGSDGTMWFATPDGLSALFQDQWHKYTTRDGLPSANVNCLFPDSTGTLWVGTTGGIATFRSGRISVPSRLPTSLRSPIFGIAEDRNGALWIATSNHVLRVARDKLARDAFEDGDLREYGITDGLTAPEGVRRDRSIVTDSLGRIWISLIRGISTTDPVRIARESAPTLVFIESAAADGNPVDLKGLHIPAGTRRIAIGYAGVNLSAPDRIRYRFALDGFDHDWNTPLAGNEAFYTNLSPGPYRFRVAASNVEGVWNGAEATIAFQVDAAFWQTWWFVITAIAGCALAIAALNRLRLRRLTRQVNMRFEERLTERNRIARELHDTLLQTIQASKMVADDALDEELGGRPNSERTRLALERLATWLEQAVVEGRAALNSLRISTADSDDLTDAFQRAARECASKPGMQIVFSVEGTIREIHPVARDEVYHIGYEAIRNACSHSGGSRLEVELNYARNLALRVRDNGKGIDPEIAANGRQAHFGLRGMAERAERVGGKLSLFSSADSGTEIELIVPGNIVFRERDPKRRNGWSRLKKLLRAEKTFSDFD